MSEWSTGYIWDALYEIGTRAGACPKSHSQAFTAAHAGPRMIPKSDDDAAEACILHGIIVRIASPSGKFLARTIEGCTGGKAHVEDACFRRVMLQIMDILLLYGSRTSSLVNQKYRKCTWLSCSKSFQAFVVGSWVRNGS